MDGLPELMTDDAPEAIIMVLGVGIALLVSTVQKRRCKQCRHFGCFAPTALPTTSGPAHERSGSARRAGIGSERSG